MPVWWVVLGVLAGLLLLTLLVLLMWKVSGRRGTLGTLVTSTTVEGPHRHRRDHETRDVVLGVGAVGQDGGTAARVKLCGPRRVTLWGPQSLVPQELSRGPWGGATGISAGLML